MDPGFKNHVKIKRKGTSSRGEGTAGSGHKKGELAPDPGRHTGAHWGWVGSGGAERWGGSRDPVGSGKVCFSFFWFYKQEANNNTLRQTTVTLFLSASLTL